MTVKLSQVFQERRQSAIMSPIRVTVVSSCLETQHGHVLYQAGVGAHHAVLKVFLKIFYAV